MNIKNILSGRQNLLTGLGVEQIGKSVFLFYKAEIDTPNIVRIAKSTDGFEFNLVKKVEEIYQPEKVSSKIAKLIKFRLGHFDAGEIVIEGVIKINQGNLVIYHHRDWPSGYQVGAAIVKNNKITFRSDTPLWESSSAWQNKKVEFIGLAYLNGQIIGYWGIDDNYLEAVIYPLFKNRSPEAAGNIKVNLKKETNNPIISPNPNNSWESSQTFNPGVILLDDKFHFLYRAIGDDGVSRLGYAVSFNGISIDNRLNFPVFEHITPQKKPLSFTNFPSGGSWSGAEDPRLVRVGNEDVLYATYTACDYGLRVGLTSISVNDFINGRWNWAPPICISPPNQTNKNWVIFPEKIRGHYAIMHAITPNIHIEYFDDLGFKGEKFITNSVNPQLVPPQNSSWDKRLRGAGAPPLKTPYGWLLFYHAMNYKVGVMLLDLEDPTKIICKSKSPVLESKEFYENTGFKPGIVYVSGAVITGGQIYVYYGGADNYVCVASANLNEFLKQLRYSETPVLEPAKIIRIK